MPEIKRTFTGGKMNKDLDERLVPNGEYRDAMNIEVLTSEGSNVGTIQNILGNTFGCQDLLSGIGHTVGSVSDERNDTLYWFTTDTRTDAKKISPKSLLSGLEDSPIVSIGEILDDTGASSNSLYDSNGDYTGDFFSFKDAIRRKKNNNCENVFIDVYGFITLIPPGNDFNVSEIDNLPEEVLQMVKEGWRVTATNELGNAVNTVTVTGQDYLAEIPFQIGYDPGVQSFGGVANGGSLGLASAGGKGANDPITFSLTDSPNIIYLPENAFSGVGFGGFSGPPPAGADIELSHTVYGVVTKPNTTVISSQVVVVEYNDGTAQHLMEIELSDEFVAGFDTWWNSNVQSTYTIAGGGNTDAMINGPASTCASQTHRLDNGNSGVSGSYTVFANYTISTPFGTPNGNLIFDDIWGDTVTGWTVGDEIISSGLYPNGGFIGSISNSSPWIVTLVDDNGDLLPPFFPSPHLSFRSGSISVATQDVGTIYFDQQLQINSNPPSGGGLPTALVFSSNENRVLRFNQNNIVNGINIIDDMLLWTDGETEPKKINIPRSIRGTDESGNRHTRLVNDSVNLGLDIPSQNLDVLIKEEHVTVIKQAPILPLSLEFSTGRNDEWDQSVPMTISSDTNPTQSSFTDSSATNGIYNFSNINAGDSFRVELPVNIDGEDTFDLVDLAGEPWKNGTEVVLREYNTSGEITIPVRDFRVKGHIGSWSGNKSSATTGDPARLEIVIDFTDNNLRTAPDGGTLTYIIDIADNSSNLFEFKFPRFSYRYKYEDGEYSTFAPFTEVAFLPGNFEFHPKEGYNLGMTNSLKSLTLKDFNTVSTPLDVISIDILYKDDQSTNIYVVDTIKPKDEVTPNPWNENSYTVTSDIIHRILPSNQLLRSFDNVPRKALAQEIVGNRVVYGNYTQGHDLTFGGVDIYPNFVHSLTTVDSDIKSIKSLREYQLGVVFVDEFGRETPVVTNKSASFKVDKNNADKKNKLNVSFTGSGVPSHMKYFKFYIKETSGEYYNMAMDRWYDAEDGSVWLSFASSDRNKVDIDTFLILKKGLESGSLVTDPARYKVLAIENEAPDFIKTTMFNCGEIKQTHNNFKLFDSGLDGTPVVGTNIFQGDLKRFGNSSLSRLDDLIVDHDIYVDFYVDDGTDIATQKYRITNCSKDEVDKDVLPLNHGTHKFTFTIDGYFEEDLNRIFNGSASSPTEVKDNVVVRFYKGITENAPRFDGKFFVKIHAEGSAFSGEIEDVDVQTIDPKKFTTRLSQKIYYLAPDHKDRHESTYDFTAFGDEDYVKDLCANTQLGLLATTAAAGGGIINFDLADKMENNKVIDTAFYIQQTYNIFSLASTPWYSTSTSLFIKVPVDYQAFRAYFKNSITDLWVKNNITDAGGGTAKSDKTLAVQMDSATSYYKASILFGIQDDGKMRNVDSNFGFEDVMFIDQGPFINTNGSFNDRWRRDGFGNDWATAQSNTRDGIVNYNSANEGRMELAFGPVAPEFGLPYEDKSSGARILGSNEHMKWEKSQEDFWNFESEQRQRYAGTQKAKLFSKLSSGTKFRWKEDPTKTIYTVFKDFQDSGRNRYSGSGKHNGFVSNALNTIDFSSSTNDTEYKSKYAIGGYQQSRIDQPFYWAGENFSKSRRVKFFPRMEWEPTMQGVEGPITNGLYIDKSKVGSAAATNIFSATNQWTNTTFSIHKQYFENTRDTSNGGFDPIEISVGMLLTHVIQSSGAAITNLTDSNGELLKGGYLIKNITRPAAGSNLYTIEFEGYTSIFSSTTPNTEPASNVNGFNSVDSGALALIFQQPAMNGLSVNSVKNVLNAYNISGNRIGIGAVGYTIEVVEEIRENKTMPTNPAIWETEPKESTGLDIYYEISAKNPIELNEDTINAALPIRSNVSFRNGIAILNSDEDPITIAAYSPPVSDTIIISDLICGNNNNNPCIDANGNSIPQLQIGDQIIVNKPNGATTYVTVKDMVPDDTDGDKTKIIQIERNLYNNNHILGWHNCYSFGNGVESNRIRDNFNLPFISNGVKASITVEDFPREEQRKYGLIYSGIYNSNSGVNNLNQFIMAEKITKDINPTYGSIQKLYTRDSDLLTLCQDKVLKILANKDAVFNADSDPQLVATSNVLGQTIPFGGEYGISDNPESFASEAYRAYFTDKVRGVVLRLSKDGLTPISEAGMKDWFRTNLKLSKNLIGSYDDRNDEYNITVAGTVNKTVSFSEKVRGWVSFKSFVPENAISCANEYYTFKNSRVWKHHSEFEVDGTTNVPRNTFYGEHTPSSFNVIFNESPSVVKSFKTLNYEGSQAKIDKLESYQIYLPGTIDPATGVGIVHPNAISPIGDGEYYNLHNRNGWYVDNIETDLEKGSLNEFIEKEGKWFNYIRGITDSVTTLGTLLGDFDSSDSSFQGLGRLTASPQIASFSGCTDAAATNYDINAVVDDGSCIDPILGCMDNLAQNYNVAANIDDGSCSYPGCTSSVAFNYDPNANVNDGSCVPFIYGCTDNLSVQFFDKDGNLIGTFPGFVNFDNTANTACDASGTAAGNNECCIATVLGCTDPTASNYSTSANTDDGSCEFPVNGCIDNTACNFDALANTNDGSCLYCGDIDADNYDGADASCTTNCLTCSFFDNSFLSLSSMNPNPTDTTLEVMWENYVGAGFVDITNVLYELRYRVSGTSTWVVSSSITPVTTGTNTYTIQNLVQNTSYEIQLRSVCTTTTSDWSSPITLQTEITQIYGCTDATATNYDVTATIDDGSCTYPVYGCTDPSALNYNVSADTDDGSCVYCVYGCTNNTMFNYDAAATCDDGSCIPVINGCTDASQYNYNATANTDDGSCEPYVYGCTDSSMTNYDPNANTSDGSCIPFAYGCMDPLACNYDATANTDDGSCLVCSASNIVTVNVSGVFAETNGVVYNDQVTTVWNVVLPDNSTGHRVKYKKSSDPNSAWVLMTGLPAGDGSVAINHLFEENEDYDFRIKTTCGTCSSSWSPITTINIGPYMGCTDPAADNYTPGASVDNGSCNYTTLGCMWIYADNYDPNANTVSFAQCTFTAGAMGCADPNNCPGCNESPPTYSASYNYHPDFTDNSNCAAFTYGCTDPTAFNYSSSAIVDDGSCIYLGCTDPTATNYDPTATVDNGSCTY